MFNKYLIFSILGLLLTQVSYATVKLLESNSDFLILEAEAVKSVLIAVPDNSRLELQVLESEAASENPVKIGIVGKIAEQAVAQILFNGSYERLRVKVKFFHHLRSSSTISSPAFDKLLDNLLLNYTSRSNNSLHRFTKSSCLAPAFPALKLSINKTGIYKMSYQDFQALGLDVAVLNSRQIHMTNKGKAIPIFISGEDDGVFSPDDALFFYAEAATEEAYTRSNVYWLSLKPDGGSRIQMGAGAPNASNSPLKQFVKTVRAENNSFYWSKMPNSENKDYLFWKQLNAGDSLDMPIALSHIVTNAQATIRVMLQGKTFDAAHNPNHHTKILLNGVEIDAARWNGQQTFVQEIVVPQAQLQDGNNIVTVKSVGDTGAKADIVYVNWLEVKYTAKLTAVADQLFFNLNASHHPIVSGFVRNDLLLLDVTNSQEVIPLLAAKVAKSDGKYQLESSNNGDKKYYATSLASENLYKPAAIEINVPTTRLQSPCNQADYLMIYHDSFDVKALESFVVNNRGFKVMAVPVSQIYNEFNNGYPHPQAIKDFISFAYHNYNKPRPTYVVLVGDANQDTLNDFGHGINYVPTHTFHTRLLGQTASDNWFVSVSGDDPLPDMFLGRIPIRKQVELDAVVKKLNQYQRAALDGWQRNFLMVADNVKEFEDVSNRLINRYLSDYNSKQLYLDKYPNKDVMKTDLIQAMNSGAIVTNYTGHGSVTNWAGEFIFESPDVQSLNNGDKLSFVMALNCLNGWFSFYQPFHGSNDSLAEALLKADAKGAIAVWAPSGLGFTPQHEVLANEFFKRLFQDMDLGALTTAAKISAVTNIGVHTDNLEMYTLFGEPSMKLRFK